jgi:hypothetical protein
MPTHTRRFAAPGDAPTSKGGKDSLIDRVGLPRREECHRGAMGADAVVRGYGLVHAPWNEMQLLVLPHALHPSTHVRLTLQK